MHGLSVVAVQTRSGRVSPPGASAKRTAKFYPLSMTCRTHRAARLASGHQHVPFSVTAQQYGGVGMQRVYALIATCIMLAACVSTGVDVKPEQLSNFIPDFSTLDDVTAQLGAPSSTTTLRDGSTILIYSFATSMPHPESFIPFIGPLFSGGEIRSSTVLFEFDEGGVLRSQRRTTSSGASGLSVLPPGVLP